MGTRQARRKLEVRRERLRQLTLPAEQVARAAGGTGDSLDCDTATVIVNGRTQSRCCADGG